MAESGSERPAGGAGARGEGAGDVRVRRAARDDMPRLHDMIHELAAYEGVPEGPQLSARELVEDGFEASPEWFFALVAERRGSGELVGYALCNRAYSSWTRRAYYVEDLFVAPSARRARVGAALLRALCQMAVAEGVRRVDWHVLETNAPARAFYARVGARDLRDTEGRAALRLDRPAIDALARGDF